MLCQQAAVSDCVLCCVNRLPLVTVCCVVSTGCPQQHRLWWHSGPGGDADPTSWGLWEGAGRPRREGEHAGLLASSEGKPGAWVRWMFVCGMQFLWCVYGMQFLGCGGGGGGGGVLFLGCMFVMQFLGRMYGTLFLGCVYGTLFLGCVWDAVLRMYVWHAVLRMYVWDAVLRMYVWDAVPRLCVGCSS